VGLGGPARGGRDGSWQLVEVVQSRLSELTRNHGQVGSDQLVYLDHRCAGCGTRGLTRLVEGTYLCTACFERRVPASPAGEEDRTSTSA